MIGRRLVFTVLLVLLVALASVAVAQQPPQRPKVLRPPSVQDPVRGFYDRQLTQIDQLIRLGHMSRANAMLLQLEESGAPVDDVRRRRIRIALGVGDHEQAVEMCGEALVNAPGEPELWRQLATAEIGRGQPDASREALDRFLGLVSNLRSGFIAAVDVMSGGQVPAATLALVDSARTELGDPTLLARPRAVSLLALGRVEEAALEARNDLVASPYNLPFLRRDLLGETAPASSRAFESALIDLAEEPGALPELAILAANGSLTRGESARALALVQPHLAREAAARAALSNATVLRLELPLLDDPVEQAAHVEYLLGILPRCAEHPALSPRQRQQALGHLAAVCIEALESDLLDEDPRLAVARFGALLELVRRGHPEEEQLYAAQIALARFTRDRLREPLAAAERLETLVMDLDLSVEGVALVRLTLGECYLAARDTARARQVLTALGRDPDFRGPAGRAHFLLARLDLAQGHVGSARDRFAAVALDSPSAPYANDALGMGLIIAEELMNPTGGPDLLLRYARAVWWDIAAEPDSQQVALERYLARAEQQVDFGSPQPLVERARLELAQLEWERGRPEAALDQLAVLITEQPDGRLAPGALALRGEILTALGDDAAAARREYERLLARYPDYLFAGEIRERLRDLP